jgi:hypothetical protein
LCARQLSQWRSRSLFRLRCWVWVPIPVTMPLVMLILRDQLMLWSCFGGLPNIITILFENIGSLSGAYLSLNLGNGWVWVWVAPCCLKAPS